MCFDYVHTSPWTGAVACSLKARFTTKNILSLPQFLPDFFPCSVPTQLCTLVFQAIHTVLCYSNTLECMSYCWSVVNLSGATLLEKMDPSSLTPRSCLHDGLWTNLGFHRSCICLGCNFINCLSHALFFSA